MTGFALAQGAHQTADAGPCVLAMMMWLGYRRAGLWDRIGGCWRGCEFELTPKLCFCVFTVRFTAKELATQTSR